MKTYIDVLWPEEFPYPSIPSDLQLISPKLPSSPIPLVIPAIPDVKGGSRNTSPDSRLIRHVPSESVVIAAQIRGRGPIGVVTKAMMR
jgi:hypothetical protein